MPESCNSHQQALKRIYIVAAQPSLTERPIHTKEGAPLTPDGEEQVLPTKEMQADKIVRENMLWATGGGLIPVPMIDMIAITAVELKMLKELSELYELPFREDQVKSILTSLVAGVGAPALGAIAASLLKAIPVLGTVSASIAVPGAAAAFTYAVGK